MSSTERSLRITSLMNRTGSSNIASRSSLLKHGEALAIDRVVFLEAPEIEPVASELGGQPARAFVLQHPADLRP